MISPLLERFFNAIQKRTAPDNLGVAEEDGVIEVGSITRQAAHYYERMRRTIDYTDDHALRRSAIERIIKRKMTFGITPGTIGNDLIVELIQAGYLPSGKLSQRIVPVVQGVIEKSLAFMEYAREADPKIRNILFDARVLSLCACEIEDILFPRVIQEEAAALFFDAVRDRIDVIGEDMSHAEINVQAYIAVRRSLLGSDNPRLFYDVWRLYYPDWMTFAAGTEEGRRQLRAAAHDFVAAKGYIERHLKHSIQARLVAKLKNDAMFYSVIMAITERSGDDAKKIFANPDLLSAEVGEFVSQKYGEEKRRVKSMARRAVIYIFLTKIILAFAIELPYDIFIAGAVHYGALFINAVFHPALLLVITAGVAVGSGENTARIIAGVAETARGDAAGKIVLRMRRLGGLLAVSYVVYGFLFLFSFGSIIAFLSRLGFTAVSIALFLMFLTLVSFFGIRIRHAAKRWIVTMHDQKLLPFAWDLLTLPIVMFGKWLTQTFSSINIFIFILDFIIETPFKALLKAFDSFVVFIKEKKEELY